MVESQRYARLQHLLDKSSIFSKLLLKKMEDQMEANKKESLRKKRVRKRKNGDDKTKDKVAYTCTICTCISVAYTCTICTCISVTMVTVTSFVYITVPLSLHVFLSFN